MNAWLIEIIDDLKWSNGGHILYQFINAVSYISACAKSGGQVLFWKMIVISSSLIRGGI
ncbi:MULTISPECIES: hypothetical protein [Cytobacillus]|uniref:hypothetical protein n=1 Tax=Cytobacillus TaxID=2675230 RepID=UPI0014170252|nr:MULTISPECIES: hypothetical protein [Cytobacillus]